MNILQNIIIGYIVIGIFILIGYILDKAPEKVLSKLSMFIVIILGMMILTGIAFLIGAIITGELK